MRQAMAQRTAPSAGARAPQPLRTTWVGCPTGAFCRPSRSRGSGLSGPTTKCGAAATERDAPAVSCATKKAAVVDDIWPPGSVGAVILGGAEADSRRLYPLTRKRTLSSIPFAGLYRLIDIPMSNCFNCGINKIYVLTAFNSASLNRYICNTYNLGTGVLAGNGFVEVVANSQTPASKAWSEGAADAVRQFMQYCFNTSASKNRSIQDILVLPADHLYSTGFTRLVNVHRQSNADLTILCHQCDDEQAEQLGVMTLDASHRVVAFKEKPSGNEKTLMSMDIDDLDELLSDASSTVTMSDASDNESNGNVANGNGTNGSSAPRAARVSSGRRGYIGSTGIMLFRREVLDQVLRDNPHIRDFGRELIPALLEGNYLVMAHGMTDFWADIGNSVRDFYEANMAMLAEKPPVDLHQRDLPFYHSLQMLPPSQVDNCHVHQSILSIGCSVRDSDIKHSIVGIRTKIAPGCTIHDSIIMGADYYEYEHNWGRECGPDFPPIGVGSNTVLKKVIVDKNSRIGSNVSLTNPDGIWESIDKLPYGICIRGGILVVPKSATIPDGTVL